MSQPTVNVVDKAQATLGGVFPILRVEDLDASLRYYETQLGFEVQWRSGAVASVQRDRAAIMLCQGDQGHAGTWLWIAVSDADAIYTELQARGARLRHAPANYPWGSRECQIMDLDDHVLRFGSDLRAGEPMGDWLDASGQRWLPAQVEAGGTQRMASDDSQTHGRPISAVLQEEGSENGQAPQSGHVRDAGSRDETRTCGAVLQTRWVRRVEGSCSRKGTRLHRDRTRARGDGRSARRYRGRDDRGVISAARRIRRSSLRDAPCGHQPDAPSRRTRSAKPWTGAVTGSNPGACNRVRRWRGAVRDPGAGSRGPRRCDLDVWRS